MERSGKKWTAYEVARLYHLFMKKGVLPKNIAPTLGRSVHALEFKAQEGGLCDSNLIMRDPIPSFFEFYRNLKRKKKIEYVRKKSGWLKKLFAQKARHIKGLVHIPDNKRYLIPEIEKWDARDMHESKDSWWKFATGAQANPVMRSHVYNREEKLCKLCSNELSEADYQAHHNDYDHKCTYRAKKIIIQYKGKDKKIPNCEACKKQNEERFLDCASRLHAVHGKCNAALAGKG